MHDEIHRLRLLAIGAPDKLPAMGDDLGYRAMRATDEELLQFRDCFVRNGSPRSIEHLQWQYRDNPTGEIFVDLAVAGSRIASIYASQPIYVRVGGRKRLGLQSLDTLTDAEYRGKGLFVKLAQSLFARAASRDVALIYGFPNGNSAHGFFKRLEWTSLDPVPFLIRPLRIPYVLDRLRLAERLRAPWIKEWVPDIPLQLVGAPAPLGWRAVEVDDFDARIDDLWFAFCQKVGVAVERNAAYLRWRLVAKPDGPYRRVALAQRDRFDAFISWCVKGKHGGRVGYVMELLHRPEKKWAAWVLLQRALREMAREGADVALAWSFEHSPNHAVHRWSGFVPFPERLRPIELHAGARAFDSSLRGIVGTRREWYVSYLDSDTV